MKHGDAIVDGIYWCLNWNNQRKITKEEVRDSLNSMSDDRFDELLQALSSNDNDKIYELVSPKRLEEA